jgi:hypothetical protein
MTRKSTDTCASCAKYPLHEAVKNGGRALCPDYGHLVHWTDTSVLHMPARDIASRTPLVKQLRAQQQGEK